MTIRDLFKRFNSLYTTAVDEDILIDYANAALAKYGHIIGRADAYCFTLAGGTALYPLPPWVRPDGIKDVIIGHSEYIAVRYGEKMSNESWEYEPGGFLHINPAPTKETECMIVCDGARCLNTLGEMAELYPDEEPETAYNAQTLGIWDDYADIIVYSMIENCAEYEEDLQTAVNAEEHVDKLLREARQSKYMKRGKYPTVREVSRRCCRCR